MGEDSSREIGMPREGAEEEVGGMVVEEDQWEDVSSDGEETFFLDPEGRVPFAGDISFDFRNAPQALTAALSQPGELARVVADCQTVFSARAKKLEYSTGETFWVQADAKPRNCLEALALDIFEAHTAGARFNSASSGAEWWTQVIDEADDIGWHWDKDYGMEAQGINVHPCLATVTYLSANGGPTVILEKRGPMACEDINGVSGKAARAWLSRPGLGKHISFDGRYLHAAPSDLALPLASEAPPAQSTPSPLSVGGGRDDGAPEEAAAGDVADAGGVKRAWDGAPKEAAVAATDAASPAKSAANGKGRAKQAAGGGSNENSNSSSGSGSGRRVTFLVNVWLNHTPKTCAPLPAATASALTLAKLSPRLAAADFVPPTLLRCHLDDEEAAEDSEVGGGCSKRRGSSTAGRDDAVPAKGSGDGEPCLSATDMRWEFGEVGDEAEDQVHLRHEVVVPVPASLAPPSEGAPEGAVEGSSFCLEFSGTRSPRVGRVGGGTDSSGSESSGEEDSDEEDIEEDKCGDEEVQEKAECGAGKPSGCCGC